MLKLTLLAAFGLAVVAVLLLLPRRAEAGGVVGSGNPASCNEAALDARLAGGGLVTFNCGSSPISITLTSEKIITLATTLDGGHVITLSGADSTRLFQVNLGAGLDLKNIALAHGRASTGGAINSSGFVIVENSTLTDNQAPGGIGGAIKSYGVLVIHDSTLSGNQSGAGFGGAISNSGTATISSSRFVDNFGGSLGGAIDNEGPLNLQSTSFTRNQAAIAGAIVNHSILTITAGSFISNTAYSGFGGGIWNDARLTINTVTFISNTASDGGALYNDATGFLGLNATTLFSSTGSGLSNAGVLTVTGSTFAGNQGGGIKSIGTATVANSTFSGNMSGAGLTTGGTASIVNSTFAGNSAGGLVNNSFFMVTIHNTLLAGNGANSCMGTITSLGHNLEDGNSCGLSAAGDITGTNPLLLPLANNGGPTFTQALKPGSPAINHGDNAGCPPADQRGIPRIGNCDIGAFESFYRLFLPLLRK